MREAEIHAEELVLEHRFVGADSGRLVRLGKLRFTQQRLGCAAARLRRNRTTHRHPIQHHLPPLSRGELQPGLRTGSGASYAALSVVRESSVPDAENDAGYNLGLLGYELTDAYRGLVDYNGGEDPGAPQFPFLFGDQRVPNVPNVYRLYHGWGEPVTDWPVTMFGMEVADFEILHVPESGYRIDPQGYQVMVIYASEQRVALNYGRKDSLAGYTLYIENVCVEPSLLALYRQLDAAGRNDLPALFGSQALGRATTSEIRVVIRDTGSAMDPRSRKDWWRGR